MNFNKILSAAMFTTAIISGPTAQAQDETAAKVENICDASGNYINPPSNRDMELETDICWMEANLVKREALVRSPEFNNVKKFTTLNGEPDEEFDAFMIASRKRIKDSAIEHRKSLKLINDAYSSEGADGFKEEDKNE